MRDPYRKPKWLKRRRLYAGGALMVLAPVACDVATTVNDMPTQADVAVETNKDLPGPELVMIAPWDPGPVDIAIAPDLNGEPDAIAIAPLDIGQQDESPMEVGFDSPMVIIPYDTGHVEVNPKTCFIEGEWCDDETVCQAQAICIVPTPCCGGCECIPLPCDPSKDNCPAGSTCVQDENTKGHCVRTNSKPRGFFEPCQSDADCLQEYFCQQTMFCIAPAGASSPCNQMNCVPISCENGQPCPEGSECLTYGSGEPSSLAAKTCIRMPGKVPGGYRGQCLNSKSCISGQYHCVDTAICILPTDCCACECLPVSCNPASTVPCPTGGACTDVGVTTVCVDKD